jgi:hypothetical protein
LNDQARTQYIGGKLSGPLYARIIWFHQEPVGDVDNIIKAILDALEQVAYDDDSSVVRCLSEKVDIAAGDYILGDDPGVATSVYRRLDTLLGQDRPHILYVEVGELGGQLVGFGPVS